MKIAVVGKGGAGKTTIAGTLARVFARRQARVLAIDGDPNPNLALTLGVSTSDADAIRFIPPTLMRFEDGEGGARRLVMTMNQDDVISQYAAKAPDGINLIVMGKPADGTAGSG